MALMFFGGKRGGKDGNGPGNGSGDGGGDHDRVEAEDRAMRAMVEEVRAYWEGLRRGTGLPHRSAIDPRGLRGALQGTFLAERIAPGMGRLRIAGMNFTDLLGMDGRGMPLSALFDPMSRARLSSLLDTCFLRPAVLDLTLRCETGLGRPELRGHMVLLPLATDEGRGASVLGCLALAGQIGRQPRRLEIAGANFTALSMPRLAPLRPLEDLSDLAKAPPALTTPEEAFEPLSIPAPTAKTYAVKPTAKGRSYLKLVDLGR